MQGKFGTYRERLQVLETTNEVLKGIGDVKGPDFSYAFQRASDWLR